MTDLDWLAAVLAALLLGVCCGLSIWIGGLNDLLMALDDPAEPDPTRSITGPLDCTRTQGVSRGRDRQAANVGQDGPCDHPAGPGRAAELD